jgi:hypothetical protein
VGRTLATGQHTIHMAHSRVSCAVSCATSTCFSKGVKRLNFVCTTDHAGAGKG